MAKRGRPTKYKPEYAQMLLDYMQPGNYIEEVEVTHTNSKGDTWSETVEKPALLRFITAFARKIDVSMETLETWAKDPEKPDFSGAYTRARQIQSEHLLTAGARGLGNATMMKFAAVNLTNLRDTSQQDIKHDVSDGLAQLMKELDGARHYPKQG